MTFRPTTDHDRAALKSAFRRLVRSGGGQLEAAQATRVGQQALSRYGSPNHPGEHVPVDVLMDLTIDTDDADVIRAMCRLANGVFVPLPKTQGNHQLAGGRWNCGETRCGRCRGDLHRTE